MISGEKPQKYFCDCRENRFCFATSSMESIDAPQMPHIVVGFRFRRSRWQIKVEASASASKTPLPLRAAQYVRSTWQRFCSCLYRQALERVSERNGAGNDARRSPRASGANRAVLPLLIHVDSGGRVLHCREGLLGETK